MQFLKLVEEFMSNGTFRIQIDGTLAEMKEAKFDSEDLLQELLAKYPSLLAGNQIERSSPRRWLLVRREMPIPCEEDGANRWSLDHFFWVRTPFQRLLK